MFEKMSILKIALLFIFSLLLSLIFVQIVYSPNILNFINFRIVLFLFFGLIFTFGIWQIGKQKINLSSILILIAILILGIALPWTGLIHLQIFHILAEEAKFFQILIFAVVAMVYLTWQLSDRLTILIKKSPKNWQNFLYSPWLIWGLILFASLLYIYYGLIRFYNFQVSTWDLGLFDQFIWNLAHFRMENSLQTISNHFGVHFQPILFFLVPIFWLIPKVQILLIVEILVICLGALPIFWIAKEKLNHLAALGIAFTYLFFIGVQDAIHFQFHPESFFPTFFAFAFYYFLKNKIFYYFLFLFLALICKENVGLYVVFFGLYLTFFTQNKKIALITIFLGFLWFWLTTSMIIPAISGQGYIAFTFNDLGKNSLEALKTILLHPIYTLKLALNPDLKITMLLYLFTSFGFLIFFAPSFLIITLPMIGERVLSSRANNYLMGFHYSVAISSVLAIGTIYGIVAFRKRFSHFLRRINLFKSWTFFSVGVVVLSCLLVNIGFRSPLIKFFHNGNYKIKNHITLEEAIKIVNQDKNAAVSVSQSVGPHISHRRKFQIVPSKKSADYILIDISVNNWPLVKENELRSEIRKIVGSKKYGILYSKGKTILFQRDIEDKVNISKEMKIFLNS
jgi:uncharacterized membrane protein